MQPKFRVSVVSFAIIPEIEGVWTTNGLAELLDKMDYGSTAGLSEDELREMCLLSLQELEPDAAAALVLKQHLGNRLKDGQIRNLAFDMADEKQWEHYADMSLHEGFFNVGSLLYAAFPGSFPEPDAVRAKLEVVAANAPANEILEHALNESFLVRLLADGVGDGSVLHRLFDEQLAGNTFPEADEIVWIVRTESTAAHTVTIEVISSSYWLDALHETAAYESSAYPDDPVSEPSED